MQLQGLEINNKILEIRQEMGSPEPGNFLEFAFLLWFCLTDSPMMLCQALLSEAFFPLCCLAIFGNEEVGGEAEGGSKRSERSEAEPGEKGESRSMSTGEPELLRGGEECCLNNDDGYTWHQCGS